MATPPNSSRGSQRSGRSRNSPQSPLRPRGRPQANTHDDGPDEEEQNSHHRHIARYWREHRDEMEAVDIDGLNGDDVEALRELVDHLSPLQPHGADGGATGSRKRPRAGRPMRDARAREDPAREVPEGGGAPQEDAQDNVEDAVAANAQVEIPYDQWGVIRRLTSLSIPDSIQEYFDRFQSDPSNFFASDSLVARNVLEDIDKPEEDRRVIIVCLVQTVKDLTARRYTDNTRIFFLYLSIYTMLRHMHGDAIDGRISQETREALEDITEEVGAIYDVETDNEAWAKMSHVIKAGRRLYQIYTATSPNRRDANGDPVRLPPASIFVIANYVSENYLVTKANLKGPSWDAMVEHCIALRIHDVVRPFNDLACNIRISLTQRFTAMGAPEQVEE